MEKRDQQGKMSRRDFAKLSAAAGFAILGSQAARAEVGNSETLKIGLLGCGSRGTGAVRDMINGNDNVQVIALADVFEDRVEGARAQFEGMDNPKIAINPEYCFAGLDAYKKICETDIDILIEGSLPYCRPYHIEAAVDAGKHIFTEKPAASDSPGIRQMLDAVRRHKEMGLSFVAGTQRRHQQEYVQTVEKIHDGAVGDVLTLRAYWNGTLPFVHDRNPDWNDLEYRLRNWINYCWTSGDNIVEQHVHNIDVCNWVVGTHPVAVVASGGRAWKPDEERYGDLYDNFSCDFEYPDGEHMFSFSRHWNHSHNDVFEEVIGTEGRTRCHALGESGTNPYVQEHINLVNSIRGTGPYYHEGEQVTESTLTAIMGRMAAYSGKRITWDEALNSDIRHVPEDLSFDKDYPVAPVPVPGVWPDMEGVL